MSFRSDLPDPVLVVDIGNTSSSAVLVGSAGTRLLAEPVSAASSWPSAVFWDGRQMLVGTQAEHHRQLDPASFGVDFKRGLTTDTSTQLGGQRFRAVQLIAALLTALRLEADRVHGAPVRRALVTVPTGYRPGDPRRAWMVAAAEAAGFAGVELLDEAVAVGHAATADTSMAAGDLVLVYAFGSSAFDVAVVRVGEQVAHVLGHASVDDCGSRDIDSLLSRRISEAGRPWLDPLISGAAGSDTALRLSMAVTEFAQLIKHQLTDSAVAEDYLLPTAPPYRLDRPELAALAAPVLNRTVACCRQLLARLDVPAGRVDTILLVGGGSRMPAVVDLLAREFGRPLRRVEEPELATVRGAVRWLQHSTSREVPAVHGPGRATPLACTLPGGSARLHRWLVEPGDGYPAGRALARVRLPDGALWDLTAAVDGTMERVLVQPGTEFATGQWLAVTRS